MKEIPLTKGKAAIVDDDDFESISRLKWHCDKNNYAVRRSRRGTGRETTRMARLIMKAPREVEVDHVDGNPLNNQKSNLRLCSHMENCHNQRNYRKRKSSRYKGVDFNKALGKWQARIGVNQQQLYLGVFDSEVDAASAYDAAATKHFGEFAATNLSNGERERK